MIEIIPSILVKSEKQFIDQIKSIKDCVGQAQLDIADGEFVPNATWANPKAVKKHSPINIELHLMVKNPMEEIKKWKKVKQIKRVLLHFETITNWSKTLDELSLYPWEIGIVLNPDTPIESITSILPQLQSVMFMGVYPGFQGQSLEKNVLIKIKDFSSKYPGMFTEIDGAVNDNTIKDIVKSGIRAVCPGSFVFNSEHDPCERINKLKSIINSIK